MNGQAAAGFSMNFPDWVETVQVIHYAGRALRLAEECSGESIEAEFVQHLAEAKSNLPEHGDGARIYEKWVKPAVVDIPRVAGHYAIKALDFVRDVCRKYTNLLRPGYRLRYSVDAEGKMRLATGAARFKSTITGESNGLRSPCCTWAITT